jgi:hypothetical protein
MNLIFGLEMIETCRCKKMENDILLLLVKEMMLAEIEIRIFTDRNISKERKTETKGIRD